MRLPKASAPGLSGFRREHLAVLAALVTAICLGAALFLSKGTDVLQPGPLISGHSAIKNCNACHTKSGTSKVSWIHGLTAADPLANSKACLTCHKMAETAFNAHSASPRVLKQSTKRLAKTAAQSSAPKSALIQDVAFPAKDVMAGKIQCATCHQEHQGVNFNLNKVSNDQCRSCHVVKFDSFDGQHPEFESFPFVRRTRIIYDHAEHFNKHFPEVAKKDPAKRIPANCSTCHNSNDDRRVMSVVPFDQTCSTCHLDQIIGKERVSGPKGIAFLALPGLDLDTLNEKKAAIGEWPDASEAKLTPFMKVMIGRNDRGRRLIKAVEGLNLQDLSKANDEQIKAVTDLVWEIKRLLYTVIKGKASDVLGDLRLGGGAKLDPKLLVDLTASIPRDVVTSSQQEWLPNLATEVVNGPTASVGKPADSNSEQATQPPAPPEQAGAPAGSNAEGATPVPVPIEQGGEAAAPADTQEAEPAVAEDTTCADEQPSASNDDAPEGAAPETGSAEAEPTQVEQTPSAEERAAAALKGRLLLPTGTPRAIKARIESAKQKDKPKEAEPDTGKATPCVDEKPSSETESVAENTAEAGNAQEAKAKGAAEAPAENEPPAAKAGDQVDDLLFPTKAELGGSAPPAGSEPVEASQPPATNASASAAGAPADANASAPDPQAQVASAASIESDVDPESWAEYGGWYRQDFAMYYRPAVHLDRFISSWLTLTGPEAPKGDAGPAAVIFDSLTNKDAQGSCTKCHSVDDVWNNGRTVNFHPASVESKKGRFTNFIHEPHFEVMDKRGCLTCHTLEKGRTYLKSYEQGNPKKYSSSFGPVKKQLCQTCHTNGMARQDCLLCHKYHIDGVGKPILNTKFPTP
jgi:hypothetical protein